LDENDNQRAIRVICRSWPTHAFAGAQFLCQIHLSVDKHNVHTRCNFPYYGRLAAYGCLHSPPTKLAESQLHGSPAYVYTAHSRSGVRLQQSHVSEVNPRRSQHRPGGPFLVCLDHISSAMRNLLRGVTGTDLSTVKKIQQISHAKTTLAGLWLTGERVFYSLVPGSTRGPLIPQTFTTSQPTQQSGTAPTAAKISTSIALVHLGGVW